MKCDEEKPVSKYIRRREQRARLQNAALRQLDRVLHDLHLGCGAGVSVHIKPHKIKSNSKYGTHPSLSPPPYSLWVNDRFRFGWLVGGNVRTYIIWSIYPSLFCDIVAVHTYSSVIVGPIILI
jgi:hypothetical protein